MTLRKKIIFSLITSFTLGLNSQFVSADTTLSQPPGIVPSKRAVEYDWMSIKAWEKMHAEDTRGNVNRG